MKAKTKKISSSIYLHLESNKYISKFEGSLRTMWNIFNDINCTDEYEIGFYSKSEAVESLDNLN
jgi:hypothetical protein